MMSKTVASSSAAAGSPMSSRQRCASLKPRPGSHRAASRAEKSSGSARSSSPSSASWVPVPPVPVVARCIGRRSCSSLETGGTCARSVVVPHATSSATSAQPHHHRGRNGHPERSPTPPTLRRGTSGEQARAPARAGCRRFGAAPSAETAVRGSSRVRRVAVRSAAGQEKKEPRGTYGHREHGSAEGR
jgi:hypothetical protein